VKPVNVVSRIAVAATVVFGLLAAGAERAPSERPERFEQALDRYDLAVQGRVDSTGDDADLPLQRAVRNLQNERAALLEYLKSRSDVRDRKAFETALRAHIAAGTALVNSAAEIRLLMNDYSARYAVIRTRTRASIDEAWKLFGRVVAHQSLVTLNRQIEELGPSLALTTVNDRNAESPAGVATVAMNEEAIVLTLNENARSFAKSQGSEWVAAMRDDLTYLSSTRVALAQAQSGRRAAADRFALTRTQLKVPAAIEVADDPPEPNPIIELSSEPAPAEVPAVSAAPLSTEVPVASAEPVATAQPTAAAPPAAPREDGGSIPWILIGAALLLLAAMLLLRLRIVDRALRDLKSASDRLAEGHADARVPIRGPKGVRTLAVAFNSMAQGVVEMQQAATEYQHQLEEQLKEKSEELELAGTDELTSLPNHRQLFMLLNHTLGRAEKTNANIAVCLLHIDNFSSIDRSMGRPFGDQVLKATSDRLQATVREFGFIARLGGHEFTVVIDRPQTVEQILAAGTQLFHVFDKPLAVEDRPFEMSVSVGVSLFPEHGRTAEALLRTADAALSRAMSRGGHQLTVFSSDLLEEASEKFVVEQGLCQAFENGEFELVHEPVSSNGSREFELAEALIRWHQPESASVSREEFLTVAEDSGLTVDLNDWATHSAIATSARWHFGRTLASLLLASDRRVDTVEIQAVQPT
jgi:diguanylate cyclase (GGDEF)-like protein